jgi:hypothetical protein
MTHRRGRTSDACLSVEAIARWQPAAFKNLGRGVF